MAAPLTKTETLTLLSLSAACIGITVNCFQGDGEPLVASLAFSGIAFALTFCLIRWLGDIFLKAGLKGRDMAKTKTTEMQVLISTVSAASAANCARPETMGAICAVVYLLMIIIFIPFPFYKDIVAATSGGGNRDVVVGLEHIETGRFLHRFPHSKVGPPYLHMDFC